MPNYFWFYLVLQLLVLMLIYQVLSDNKTLNFRLQQTQCKSNHENSDKICTPPQLLNQLNQLQNRIYINLNEHSPVFQENKQKITKNERNVYVNKTRTGNSKQQQTITQVHKTETRTVTNSYENKAGTPNSKQQHKNTYAYKTQ